MKKKATIAVTALALVLCFAIGGTLAWLVDESDKVVNTFTYGDINIGLSETTGDEYKMIPGNDITKDPKVTVDANSEACWLFVKVEKSDNYDSYLTDYAIADGWTELASEAGTNYKVYYREVDAATAKAGTSYQVLAGKDGYSDGYVTVNSTVTKEMMNAIDGIADSEEAKNTELATRPSLAFTAYAVQKDGFATAALAWAEINK